MSLAFILANRKGSWLRIPPLSYCPEDEEEKLMGIILQKAQQLAQNGILSEAECGQLLSEALEDGKISYGERTDLLKVRDQLSDKLTDKARGALQSFLAMGPVFDGNVAGKIFGVDDAKGEKLEAAGVTTVRDLLTAAKTPSARASLATKSEIDLVELTDFAERADLARVTGIGQKYACVLDRIGVNNVQNLGQQDAATLRQEISDFLQTDAGQKITKSVPSQAKIEKWIEAAQILPFVLYYADDNGANFTLTAFNALTDQERGRLMMGVDVRLSGGVVYEHESLGLEPVARRSGALKTFCDDMERDPTIHFSADEEIFDQGVKLRELLRVKIGDETVGFRAAFDVYLTESQSYGWEGSGDEPEFGAELTVALNKNAEILASDLNDTYDRYGDAEWDS